MKVLVAGLGSMGKRRIRCLKRLSVENIVGFDPRQDRRAEAQQLYGIAVVDRCDHNLLSDCDAVVISTPPDRHIDFIRVALESRKPAFVEASVTLDGLDEARRIADERKILIAPSCTMRFHPAIREIKRLITSGVYGRTINFSYHFGHYLPDWHPWESVRDFYVSKQETGACREMLPFELAWIVDIVGVPLATRGFYGRTRDIGADIDDTYALVLKFPNCYGSVIVDVVSRYAIRKLTLNMERGQVEWRWDDPVIHLYDANRGEKELIKLPEGESHAGYNKNIIEDMYVEELASFLAAVRGEEPYPNSLVDDIAILRILHEFEKQNKQ